MYIIQSNQNINNTLGTYVFKCLWNSNLYKFEFPLHVLVRSAQTTVKRIMQYMQIYFGYSKSCMH